MRDEFHQKNQMYNRVETVLRDATNEPLWLDQPKDLTSKVTSWESKASALGAFGSQHETDLSGVTEQQNAAEQALETAAFNAARKLRNYYKNAGNTASAAKWDMSQTEWQKIREDALLTKATDLYNEAQPLTTGGPPPPGDEVGLDAATVADLKAKRDTFKDEIGKPSAARKARKAQGEDLRTRYAGADDDLSGVDDYIEALRGKSDAHRVFVQTYFNARRIGGEDHGHGGAPPPPASPKP